jgi:thiol-disulfide isomerase/thioredoxin
VPETRGNARLRTARPGGVTLFFGGHGFGRARMAGALVAALLVVVSVSVARADQSRFVPWKDGKTPPLSLRDLAGRIHTLADYRGKVVLVNFWATWCEPCREEMPSMQRLRERLAARPFAILAVNYGESETRAADFVTRSALDLTVLLDPGQAVARAWRVRILPASVLVGPDGRARYAVIGEIDWMSKDAVDTVERLLP